jgi:large subunit ribosomal protein L32
MGALPFRRISKTRKRLRRTHMKLDLPGTTTCPKCGAVIKPHRACTECGNYKGKEVIKTAKTEE